jgi:hypothetical protein
MRSNCSVGVRDEGHDCGPGALGLCSGSRNMEEGCCKVSDKQSQNRIAQQQLDLAVLQTAVGQFLTAFAMAESILLTGILGALTMDKPAMEHLEDLMDFSDRLKLMLRLTDDRYPAHRHEARAINKAAKTLAEHRNKIAHGGAMIAFAGGFGEDAPFIAGIRKRTSERVYPAVENPGEAITTDAVKGMFITVDEVREQTAEAVKLQRQMNRFRLRLHHVRYGTPAPQDDPAERTPAVKKKGALKRVESDR